MEWLEGIPAKRVRELVLASLAESGVPNEVLSLGCLVMHRRNRKP